MTAGGGWSEEEIDGETTCSDVGGGGSGSGEDDNEEEIQEIKPNKVARIKKEEEESPLTTKKPEFVCQLCNRTFPYKSMFQLHQKSKMHLRIKQQSKSDGGNKVSDEIAEKQVKLVELGVEIDRVKQELHVLLLERETNLFQLAELYKQQQQQQQDAAGFGQ
ncbi:hypothetical protein BASA81_003746 [Batrachochytrium salamandrivorans]|nr:hypothetical protein BASA81_003746 [Batrachochytrium salamandrivorans]